MLEFILMAGVFCWVLIAGALGLISAETANGFIQVLATLVAAALALRAIVYLLGDHRSVRSGHDQRV